MNTPTHLILSVATLTRRRENGPSYITPAVIGALLPDAPMFAFYFIEKFWIGSSEREIWTTRYFMTSWQNFFDLFNSVPIVALGLWLSWKFSRMGWFVLFASMMIHIAYDLPLHHDDGHRHFWPLLNWRFESPISYWDPNHHGGPAALAEILLFIVCYIVSMRRHDDLKTRIGLSTLTAIHIGFIAFALLYWVAG